MRYRTDDVVAAFQESLYESYLSPMRSTNYRTPPQLWNGRCTECGSGVTLEAKIEDIHRPAPTSQEIVEFLRHMDDLNALKKSRELTILFVAFFGFAHMLLGIGMGCGYIAPHFGVISWVLMGGLLVTIGIKEFETGCPRCKQPFGYKTVLGFRFHSRVADSCAHCGLRALSQDDIRRATDAEQLWKPGDSEVDHPS